MAHSPAAPFPIQPDLVSSHWFNVNLCLRCLEEGCRLHKREIGVRSSVVTGKHRDWRDNFRP